MQALYDLTAPGGIAPDTTTDPAAPTRPAWAGPQLLEVRSQEDRRGRGRWWGPNAAGYTDQLDRAGLYDADSDPVRDHLGYQPGESHTHVVDGRVVVGPAVRLLAMLRQVDAACDTDDDLGALLDPDDRDGRALALLHEYVALRDAAALGQAVAEAADMPVHQLLLAAAQLPRLLQALDEHVVQPTADLLQAMLSEVERARDLAATARALVAGVSMHKAAAAAVAAVVAWLRGPDVSEDEARAWLEDRGLPATGLERHFNHGDTCWTARGHGIVAYDFKITRERRRMAEVIEQGAHLDPLAHARLRARRYVVTPAAEAQAQALGYPDGAGDLLSMALVDVARLQAAGRAVVVSSDDAGLVERDRLVELDDALHAIGRPS